MSQHHFIIHYNTDSKEWVWDIESEQARFTEGSIYADEKWVGNTYTEPIQSIDNVLAEDLGLIINQLNREASKWA